MTNIIAWRGYTKKVILLIFFLKKLLITDIAYACEQFTCHTYTINVLSQLSICRIINSSHQAAIWWIKWLNCYDFELLKSISIFLKKNFRDEIITHTKFEGATRIHIKSQLSQSESWMKLGLDWISSLIRMGF